MNLVEFLGKWVEKALLCFYRLCAVVAVVDRKSWVSTIANRPIFFTNIHHCETSQLIRAHLPPLFQLDAESIVTPPEHPDR